MSETDFSSLKNHFLLAMPALRGSTFADAVIYLCDHGPEGAMGLVVNHPMEVPLSEVFEQFELDYPESLGREPLLAGGPVQVERGFVLHRPAGHHWETTMDLDPEICLTASSDIIVDLARQRGPAHSLIALGYAGWGAGQLEQELADNSWLVTPADPDILFDLPMEERAKAVAASIGIDLSRLSSEAGHA